MVEGGVKWEQYRQNYHQPSYLMKGRNTKPEDLCRDNELPQNLFIFSLWFFIIFIFHHLHNIFIIFMIFFSSFSHTYLQNFLFISSRCFLHFHNFLLFFIIFIFFVDFSSLSYFLFISFKFSHHSLTPPFLFSSFRYLFSLSL